MTDKLPPAQAILKQIPAPHVCRQMLARAISEVELLRRLLKVSQRKADCHNRTHDRKEAS
jgi:hypothetical protein